MNISYNISITDLLTSFSIIIAVLAFIWDRKKTRESRETEIFDSLNERWIDLLEKFTEYPEIILDFGGNNGSVSKDEKKKIIYYHILLSTLEMAYLKYSKASKKIRKNQWQGWDEYIGELFNESEMKKLWHDQLFDEYDKNFVRYINSKLGNVKGHEFKEY